MTEPPREKIGVAGRFARAFIDSKITPIALIASAVLGGLAVWQLPREEEPQIIVPMIDVFVSMPGKSAREVEHRVTKPMEKLLWEVPGVEYIYSTSSPGRSMVIVRFEVGMDEEDAIVRLNQKMSANFDKIPPGASRPLVKPRSIDDVPILALTLWGERYGGFELRRIAAELAEAIKQIPDVSEVSLIGGHQRQVRVLLDPERMAARGLSPLQVARAVQAANSRSRSGSFTRLNEELIVETGRLLRSEGEVRRVVVGVSEGQPVYLGDVARIEDGGEEPDDYVMFGHGAASAGGEVAAGVVPAVTVSVAKLEGTNAIDVIERIMKRVEGVKGTLIPSDVNIDVTRDYGHTAGEKSNELLFHMMIAIASVSLLIWFVLGRREAAIVLLAIPATLALTLAVFYFWGYTLNRITLFALIFSIGILVDDAIVVVENVARHCRLPENKGCDPRQIAVRAVDEVGNPTILATMTVIAAILPMAFVGGLMGPYMRPIPVGATAAMLFSLVIAFSLTPWATVRILKCGGDEGHDEEEGLTTRLYRRVTGWLLQRPRRSYAFMGAVVVALVAAIGLLAVRWVQVKMLPFDNKSELNVVVDMPEGTPLEETARVTRAIAERVRTQPEVVDFQMYVGTASPYTFNGLVRHYFLRTAPHMADIQVNLVGKGERDLASHDVAKAIRARVAPVAEGLGARVKVTEVPPGPPVRQTLVAEIYGPDQSRRIAIGRQIRSMMEGLEGVVDVDWEVEARQPKVQLVVDREKAALAGVSEAALARTMRLASAGVSAGLLHEAREKEDVPILLRLDKQTRSDLGRLRSLRVRGRDGQLVSVGELVRVERVAEDRSIHHKNLMPVTYVTADMAGEIESPVYAILQLGDQIEQMTLPEGYALEQHTASLPYLTDRYALKWDGEWQITYEVFRDLGLAFALVIILIYILVVAWFQSFWIPLVIMSVIPISLVGILPAHGLLGAFFTATSMIGFIAGAGIVVRNSIILVDFIHLRLDEGMPLEEAVVDAGAVRFRPMLLTAAAVVVGAGVILFDPIFQGLAIALMAGEVASLLLSRETVPLAYYLVRRRQRQRAARRADSSAGSPPARERPDEPRPGGRSELLPDGG